MFASKSLSRLKFKSNSFVVPNSHTFCFALDSLFHTHIIFILRDASFIGWMAVAVVDAVGMYVAVAVVLALNSCVLPYSHNFCFALDLLFPTHIIFILRNASSIGWVAVVVADAVAMYVVAAVVVAVAVAVAGGGGSGCGISGCNGSGGDGCSVSGGGKGGSKCGGEGGGKGDGRCGGSGGHGCCRSNVSQFSFFVVAVMIIVAAMCNNFHFLQCLLHWMDFGSGG